MNRVVSRMPTSIPTIPPDYQSRSAGLAALDNRSATGNVIAEKSDRHEHHQTTDELDGQTMCAAEVCEETPRDVHRIAKVKVRQEVKMISNPTIVPESGKLRMTTKEINHQREESSTIVDCQEKSGIVELNENEMITGNYYQPEYIQENVLLKHTKPVQTKPPSLGEHLNDTAPQVGGGKHKELENEMATRGLVSKKGANSDDKADHVFVIPPVPALPLSKSKTIHRHYPKEPCVRQQSSLDKAVGRSVEEHRSQSSCRGKQAISCNLS